MKKAWIIILSLLIIIISKYNKLSQKYYKTGHDWMGKMVHKELCKKLKPDHTTERYMHKRQPYLENGI